MAGQHVETNPHFIDPKEITPEQRLYLPDALLPRRGGHNQRIPSRGPQDQRPHSQPQNLPPPTSIQGEMTPQGQDKHLQEDRNKLIPPDRPTHRLTWFAAAFCAFFWLAIIIGGLVVLIVYLVFRPRSPRFDVNGVTLNAAYLDMDNHLLNADLSVLANFTNPNKKVNVDFSSMYLYLYFENTVIASQYIEPFSAARGQSMFAYVHMVASQVRLSMKKTLLLQKQIENNRVIFKLKGVFRARSTLGGFIKYKYWLHCHCSIMVTSPPTGVLREKRCRTKH